MSENESAQFADTPTTPRSPSTSDGLFSERLLDAIVGTPPVPANVVSMTNPTPEGEDFDA